MIVFHKNITLETKPKSIIAIKRFKRSRRVINLKKVSKKIKIFLELLDLSYEYSTRKRFTTL